MSINKGNLCINLVIAEYKRLSWRHADQSWYYKNFGNVFHCRLYQEITILISTQLLQQSLKLSISVLQINKNNSLIAGYNAILYLWEEEYLDNYFIPSPQICLTLTVPKVSTLVLTIFRFSQFDCLNKTTKKCIKMDLVGITNVWWSVVNLLEDGGHFNG